MCDLVYTLRLEELRQQVTAATIGALVASAMGAQTTIPDFDTARTEFDTALAAVPEQIADPDRYELMRALHLR